MPKLKPFIMTPDTYADPDLQIKPCEADGCTAIHERRHMFSFIVSMSHYHIKKGVYSSYQCSDEQHWTCSHEHAIQAAKKCIDEHHAAEHLIKRSLVTFKLPQGTVCAICEKLLTTEAYNIAVCYATPGHGFAAYACGRRLQLPDGTERFLPDTHWCCREEHAREAAHACMEEHLDYGLRGCCNDETHEHTHPDPARWHTLYEATHRRKAIALCVHRLEPLQSQPQGSQDAQEEVAAVSDGSDGQVALSPSQSDVGRIPNA